MDKMRWFIVGNLIGFAVLVCGVALNDSFRHKEEAPETQASDQPTNSQPANNQSTSSQSAAGQQNTNQPTTNTPAIAEAGDTTSRLVTTRDISKGTVLHAGDVEMHPVQLKRVKADGFTDVEPALGRKTRIDLVEGEMLESVDLEKK